MQTILKAKWITFEDVSGDGMSTVTAWSALRLSLEVYMKS